MLSGVSTDEMKIWGIALALCLAVACSPSHPKATPDDTAAPTPAPSPLARSKTDAVRVAKALLDRVHPPPKARKVSVAPMTTLRAASMRPGEDPYYVER